MTPSVDLYIPCFNAAANLESVLSAVFEQRVKPSKVLLVDDCSTDDSISIAQKFPLGIVRHEINRGLAAARNSALESCEAKYIASIDSDVLIEKDWLENLLQTIESTQAAAVGGRMFEKFQENIADRWRARMLPQHHGNEVKQGLSLFGCNTVVRREAALAIGGYDQKYRTNYEDVDFCERLKSKGFDTVYDPSAICWHLRKDSIASVLDTCYNWRKPGYVKADAYSDGSRLASKWIVATMHDVADIKALASEGLSEQLYLSFLYIGRSFFKDLIYFIELNPDQHARDFACLACKVVRSLMFDMKGLSSEFKLAVQEELDKIAASSSLGELELLNVGFERIKEKAMQPLVACFEQLLDLLTLDSVIIAQLESSFRVVSGLD